MARSRKRPARELDVEVEGRGKTLEVAMDDFAVQAIEAGLEAGAVVSVSIAVEVHNPHVSEYFVRPSG